MRRCRRGRPARVRMCKGEIVGRVASLSTLVGGSTDRRHCLAIWNAPCITSTSTVIPRTRIATTVTRKGQVTIPKRVRDRLAIGPGSRVEFELTPNGEVVLLKVGEDKPANRFDALRGRAGAGMTTDQIMALTRGET
ncbi:MAG: AbrB family transcriptional regulator [Caulobacteraceae bacterium]|nr:AbrB family transcriptional regulator [Caulobacteraceae bacterium]